MHHASDDAVALALKTLVSLFCEMPPTRRRMAMIIQESSMISSVSTIKSR
jgi:hypothetical protein